MFSGSQVRIISKLIMMNVDISLKTLIVTRITGPSLAGESDVVSRVNCGWSSDLDVVFARGD